MSYKGETKIDLGSVVPNGSLTDLSRSKSQSNGTYHQSKRRGFIGSEFSGNHQLSASIDSLKDVFTQDEQPKGQENWNFYNNNDNKPDIKMNPKFQGFGSRSATPSFSSLSIPTISISDTDYSNHFSPLPSNLSSLSLSPYSNESPVGNQKSREENTFKRFSQLLPNNDEEENVINSYLEIDKVVEVFKKLACEFSELYVFLKKFIQFCSDPIHVKDRIIYYLLVSKKKNSKLRDYLDTYDRLPKKMTHNSEIFKTFDQISIQVNGGLSTFKKIGNLLSNNLHELVRRCELSIIRSLVLMIFGSLSEAYNVNITLNKLMLNNKEKKSNQLILNTYQQLKPRIDICTQVSNSTKELMTNLKYQSFANAESLKMINDTELQCQKIIQTGEILENYFQFNDYGKDLTKRFYDDLTQLITQNIALLQLMKNIVPIIDDNNGLRNDAITLSKNTKNLISTADKLKIS